MLIPRRRTLIQAGLLACFAVAATAATAAFVPTERQVAAADAFIYSREIVRNPRRPAENRLEYRDARAYALGDVTGDGISDLVIQFTLEEGENWSLHLAVLTGPSLRRPWSARVGSKGWRSVELDGVVESGIDLVTMNYSPEDDSCCPTLPGSATFYLVDGELEETETRIDCGDGGGEESMEEADEGGTLASMRVKNGRSASIQRRFRRRQSIRLSTVRDPLP